MGQWYEIQRTNEDTGAVENIHEIIRQARENDNHQFADLVNVHTNERQFRVAVFIDYASDDPFVSLTDPCNCGCGAEWRTGNEYPLTDLRERLYAIGALIADHRSAPVIAQLYEQVDGLTTRVNELAEQKDAPHFEIGDRWLIEDAVDALIREMRRSTEQTVSDYQQRRNSLMERLFGQ